MDTKNLSMVLGSYTGAIEFVYDKLILNIAGDNIDEAKKWSDILMALIEYKRSKNRG